MAIFRSFPAAVPRSGHGSAGVGNQIPKTLLDPVITKLAALLPTAANYGDRYNWSYSEPALNHEMLGKVTHQFNTANQAEVSYLRTWGNVTYPGTDSSGNNAPAFGPEYLSDP